MEDGFSFTQPDLTVAGVMVAAGPLASRSYGYALAPAAASPLPSGLSSEVAGFWRRKSLGLVSFASEAFPLHSVSYKENIVAQTLLGLFSEASPVRCEEARGDLKSFICILLLFAWRSGSWPVRWLETSVDCPRELDR